MWFFGMRAITISQRKIRRAEREGIAEALMHDFKRFGRNNYSLTKLAQRRIVSYYVSPKKYNKKQITDMVNEELVGRGLKPISYSTVSLYLRNHVLKNQYDLFRNGKRYSEQNTLSYLTRKDPQQIADLYQIDSTRLGIPYKTKSGDIAFLNMCVVMDVFSRKIIGHSFSETENYIMILEAIKMAFEEFEYIPGQVVIDNSRSYSSSEFVKFSQKMDNYGVYIRKTKPYNPGDKGHVERWFRTFTDCYLNKVFGSVGHGIKSKHLDSRVSPELEKYYRKKQNLRSKYELVKLVSHLIQDYNKDIKRKRKKESWFSTKDKFLPHNIADIFFSTRHLLVRRSMICFHVDRKRHTYTIHNHLMANKLNNSSVNVRFDKENPSRIYLFQPENNEYLGSLIADQPISILPSPGELHKAKKFNQNVKNRIQKMFDKAVDEIEKGKIELESHPIIHKYSSNQMLGKVLRQAEDDVLLSEMLNQKSTYGRSSRNTDRNKEKYLTDKTYQKVKKKQIKPLEEL